METKHDETWTIVNEHAILAAAIETAWLRCQATGKPFTPEAIWAQERALRAVATPTN